MKQVNSAGYEEASKETKKQNRLKHDEYCFACGCGGTIVECDVCPRVFHPECVNELLQSNNFNSSHLAKTGSNQVPECRASADNSVSFSDSWICPWHSCNVCRKASMSMVNGSLAWDEELLQASCVSCPLTYCISCCPPDLQTSALNPSEKIISTIKRYFYTHNVTYFVCSKCQENSDDAIDSMIGLRTVKGAGAFKRQSSSNSLGDSKVGGEGEGDQKSAQGAPVTVVKQRGRPPKLIKDKIKKAYGSVDDDYDEADEKQKFKDDMKRKSYKAPLSDDDFDGNKAMTEKKKKAKKIVEVVRSVTQRPLLCLHPDTLERVRYFATVGDAAIVVLGNWKVIMDAVEGINNPKHIARYFVWRFADTVPPFVHEETLPTDWSDAELLKMSRSVTTKVAKPLVALSLHDGRFLQKFDSGSEAAAFFLNPNFQALISNCCCGKNQHALGLLWRFAVDVNIDLLTESLANSVYSTTSKKAQNQHAQVLQSVDSDAADEYGKESTESTGGNIMEERIPDVEMIAKVKAAFKNGDPIMSRDELLQFCIDDPSRILPQIKTFPWTALKTDLQNGLDGEGINQMDSNSALQGGVEDSAIGTKGSIDENPVKKRGRPKGWRKEGKSLPFPSGPIEIYPVKQVKCTEITANDVKAKDMNVACSSELENTSHLSEYMGSENMDKKESVVDMMEVEMKAPIDLDVPTNIPSCELSSRDFGGRDIDAVTHKGISKPANSEPLPENVHHVDAPVGVDSSAIFARNADSSSLSDASKLSSNSGIEKSTENPNKNENLPLYRFSGINDALQMFPHLDPKRILQCIEGRIFSYLGVRWKLGDAFFPSTSQTAASFKTVSLSQAQLESLLTSHPHYVPLAASATSQGFAPARNLIKPLATNDIQKKFFVSGNISNDPSSASAAPALTTRVSEEAKVGMKASYHVDSAIRGKKKYSMDSDEDYSNGDSSDNDCSDEETSRFGSGRWNSDGLRTRGSTGRSRIASSNFSGKDEDTDYHPSGAIRTRAKNHDTYQNPSSSSIASVPPFLLSFMNSQTPRGIRTLPPQLSSSFPPSLPPVSAIPLREGKDVMIARQTRELKRQRYMQKESHVAVFCYTLPDINEATEMEVEESATQVGQSNQLSDPRKSTLIATFPSLEEAAKALLQIEYLHQLRNFSQDITAPPSHLPPMHPSTDKEEIWMSIATRIFSSMDRDDGFYGFRWSRKADKWEANMLNASPSLTQQFLSEPIHLLKRQKLPLPVLFPPPSACTVRDHSSEIHTAVSDSSSKTSVAVPPLSNHPSCHLLGPYSRNPPRNLNSNRLLFVHPGSCSSLQSINPRTPVWTESEDLKKAADKLNFNAWDAQIRGWDGLYEGNVSKDGHQENDLYEDDVEIDPVKTRGRYRPQAPNDTDISSGDAHIPDHILLRHSASSQDNEYPASPLENVEDTHPSPSNMPQSPDSPGSVSTSAHSSPPSSPLLSAPFIPTPFPLDLTYGTIPNDKKKENSHGRDMKPVDCFSADGEYIRTYRSGSDASRALGINQAIISQCCNGRVTHAGNYQWKFSSLTVAEVDQRWKPTVTTVRMKKTRSRWDGDSDGNESDSLEMDRNKRPIAQNGNKPYLLTETMKKKKVEKRGRPDMEAASSDNASTQVANTQRRVSQHMGKNLGLPRCHPFHPRNIKAPPSNTTSTSATSSFSSTSSSSSLITSPPISECAPQNLVQNESILPSSPSSNQSSSSTSMPSSMLPSAQSFTTEVMDTGDSALSNDRDQEQKAQDEEMIRTEEDKIKDDAESEEDTRSSIANINYAEMMSEGWTFNPADNAYIGLRARKFFPPPHGLSEGVIIGHLPPEKNEGLELWHFLHDDGDTEDFEGYEVAMFRAYLEKDIRVDPESFRGRKRMKRSSSYDPVEALSPLGIPLYWFESAEAASKLLKTFSIQGILKSCRLISRHTLPWIYNLQSQASDNSFLPSSSLPSSSSVVNAPTDTNQVLSTNPLTPKSSFPSILCHSVNGLLWRFAPSYKNKSKQEKTDDFPEKTEELGPPPSYLTMPQLLQYINRASKIESVRGCNNVKPTSTISESFPRRFPTIGNNNQVLDLPEMSANANDISMSQSSNEALQLQNTPKVNEPGNCDILNDILDDKRRFLLPGVIVRVCLADLPLPSPPRLSPSQPCPHPPTHKLANSLSVTLACVMKQPELDSDKVLLRIAPYNDPLEIPISRCFLIVPHVSDLSNYSFSSLPQTLVDMQWSEDDAKEFFFALMAYDGDLQSILRYLSSTKNAHKFNKNLVREFFFLFRREDVNLELTKQRSSDFHLLTSPNLLPERWVLPSPPLVDSLCTIFRISKMVRFSSETDDSEMI